MTTKEIFKNLDMATVSNIGLMALIMKVSGTSTKLKAKVHSGMPKVMSIAESSKTTWPMVTVNIHT